MTNLPPSSKFVIDWFLTMESLVGAIFVYVTIIAVFKFSPKRTLSRLTAFDLIIPLTLGPIMAMTILDPDVTYIQGLLSFAFLIVLHTIVSRLMTRSEKFLKAVRSEPVLLFHNGQLLKKTMRREMVTDEDIQEALHTSGLDSFDHVKQIILESDGGMSIIRKQQSRSSASKSSTQSQSGAPGVSARKF